MSRRAWPAIALLGVLMLGATLALSGSTYIGAAGAPTTMEESPPTTDRTPGTSTATGGER